MAFDGSVDIVIDAFTNALKIPGFYGETVHGASPINIQNLPLTVLASGLKATSGGTMVVDQDVTPCNDASLADTLAGPGSELARLAYAILANGEGYLLYLAAPAPNGSAVAATATITITGTSTGAGTHRYFACGYTIDVQVPSGATPTTAAGLAVTAFNQITRLPFTASNVAGVITLTMKFASIRGNAYMIYQDSALAPASQSSAITGGSTVLSSVSSQTGKMFTGGTTVEDITLMLAATLNETYERQVWAANDTTNLALLEPQIDAKALPGVEQMEHVCIGLNGTSGAATSIGQTTLNNPRFELVWLQNCEIPGPELAACMIGRRAQDEQREPNTHYNNVVLKGVPPLRYIGYRASRATIQTCLDNSVTPLQSSKTAVSVVRAITTRSLNGSTPDWRCLDVGQAVVPDYIRKDTKLFWDQEVVLKNKYAQRDPLPGEKVGRGTMYPQLWASLLLTRAIEYQKRNLITQVAQNPPTAVWNPAAMGGNGAIVSTFPCVVKPKNHAVGVKFLQLNAA